MIPGSSRATTTIRRTSSSCTPTHGRRSPAIDGLPAPTAAPDTTREASESSGGSSFAAGPYFTPHVTPVAGLRAALGPSVAVDDARGCHHSDPADAEIVDAVVLASEADVAIVFVGAKSGIGAGLHRR